ncbi:hypothetical protein K435DRAFT_839838 [Dendrothele bispora CBS 962.96]|uniref:F-box domain-containing protein n=1 Tax=Dendrothele bispora (strain CBS 962.96) TaxID=1314807 RepID=A0A4S8LXW5_DENBC|nr:hypothetical protein K435DRAFT_839838 [Dendrothele bispora CBS 962.96]
MSLSSSTVLCDRCHATLVVDDPLLPWVAQERLRNYDIPSDMETSRITALLDQTEPEIARYESEIARLEDTLATLRARRDELKRYQGEYKTLLSPIRRMPIDILLEIFSIVCSESGGSLSMPKTRSSSRQPRDHRVITATTLSLSQICSFWRGVVMNSPCLWSTLAVNLALITDIEENGIWTLVYLYLTRSSSFPLTLDIFARNCSGHLIEILPSYAWGILKLLMDQSHRWRDISFGLHWNVYNGMMEHEGGLDGLASRNCTHLQSFKFFCQPDAPIGETNDLFTSQFLLQAPALHSVTLQFCDPDFALPSGQLRSIVILQGSYLSDVFSLLNECPQLETLELSFGPTEADDLAFVLSQPREIVLGSLNSLKLTSPCSNYVSVFFSALKLPTLAILDLQVSKRFNNHGPCGQSLKDMILRSSCQLQKMVLRGENLELQNNTLLDILLVTPQLKSFELNTFSRYYRTLPSQSFDVVETGIALVSSKQEIALHSLQSLKLSCFRAADVSVLISVLKLPSLTALDLGVQSSSNEDDCEPDLKEMILRSSCQLKELILRRGEWMLTGNALLDILLITPHLRSLLLRTRSNYFTILTDELFQALICRPDTDTSGTLIPQLRTLKIEFIRLCSQSTQPKLPDPDIILAMVTSRRNIWIPDSSVSMSAIDNFCTPLESFELRADTVTRTMFDRSDDVIEWGNMLEPRLRALESEGLVLTLRVGC